MAAKSFAIPLALAAWLLVAPAAFGEGRSSRRAETAFAGRSLTEALEILQGRGLAVFFSSRVVTESMRVETEPRGASLREVLDELLRPQGLAALEVVKGRLVVVPAPAAPASQSKPPKPREPAPLVSVSDEILVTPDEPALHGPVETLSLDLVETAGLPHLGDDVFRALGLLPGAAGTETSSQLSVRGSRDDEVLVVLDGLELLAPYHLQELDSALSIVSTASLGKVDLSTGGFPAQYGDRMSGVVDMTTLYPPPARRFTLGLGLLFGEASASGALPGERGRWLAGARAGDYHLPLEVYGREENPTYWDSFGKVGLSLRSGQALQLNVLAAQDELGLSADEERYGSRWGNRYLWLTHSAVVGSDLFVESIGSLGRVDRGRSGSGAGSFGRFTVRDRRRFDLDGLKQVWSVAAGARSSFAAGLELRELSSAIDYLADREPAAPPASFPIPLPAGVTRVERALDFTQTGAFVSSRLRPLASLSLELGARYDRESRGDESRLSPRVSLAWEPRAGSTFRLAWGWFHQSQRPNELQVEDGETELAPAEGAEHRIVGFEHRSGSGATLRVEAYERRLSRPRLRFENLFDPAVLFPELSADRVRIAPEGGRARGIDLLYRSAQRGPFSWWLTYTLSSIEDEIDGRMVPRSIDQTHALRADLGYRTPAGWSWNAAWLYHSGWPTTRVAGRLTLAADGSTRIEPVLGPLNGERLPPYHRLDLRVSHAWELPRGQLSAYLEVQNLYDRENVRGFEDFTFELGPAGEVRVRSGVVSWGSFLPSFGIRWRL